MAETVEFAFRRKYNLPPLDQRALDMTVEDMLADLLAHQLFEREGNGEEFEDEEFDLDSVMNIEAAGDDWEDLINEQS